MSIEAQQICIHFTRVFKKQFTPAVYLIAEKMCIRDRGKTPDPKDLELVKTEKQNAFAISQYPDIMTIQKFAKHITSHGSVYS